MRLRSRDSVAVLLGGCLLSGAIALDGRRELGAQVAGGSPPAVPASAPDSLDDGPHVYWRDARTALAFYHCGGDFRATGWFEVEGSASFRGLCADTARTYTVQARTPRPAPDRFDRVPKIFAVSDIHGEYAALVALLRGAGVVDDELGWAWGEGHLVIAGDVLDRGAAVTECLWLIHRLEQEALAAGGRVHYLLGNHEVMVMQGDERYVNARYLAGVVESSGVEYRDLFGPATEFGRWLRTRHVAVRLNGVLFTHGGMGPGVLERDLDLQDLNEQARAAIDLRSYDLVFKDMPSFLVQRDGPLWYRGYHRSGAGTPQPTPEEMDAILRHFGASAVVVGHTDVGQVSALYGGKVYGIDMDLDGVGALQGLLWEGGTFYRVGSDGAREILGGT